MLCIDAAREAEYTFAQDDLDDADLSSFKTFIWYRSARGEAVARRVAQELAGLGFAFVYPADRDLVIHVGKRHRVIELRAAA